MATDIRTGGVDAPTVGAGQESIAADYTEAVVPLHAKRSNFRVFLVFMSMQLVFGAVLVGYSARFQNLTLGQLILAMPIAAATMTVYCIGSAKVRSRLVPAHALYNPHYFRRDPSRH